MTGSPSWKALEILGQAHRRGLQLLDEMERAVLDLKRGSTGEATIKLRALLVFFNGELRTHFLHEEEGLFPAMSHAIGPMGPVEVMLEEHRTLWQAIDSLEERLGALDHGEQGASDEVQRVASHIVWKLRSHIQKEDEMLFPLAQTHLGEGERLEVTRIIEARPV